MGRSSRDKGARYELELAKRTSLEKVPLSGAAQGWPGDLQDTTKVFPEELGKVWSVKARSMRSHDVWATTIRSVFSELRGPHEVLALRAIGTNGRPGLVVGKAGDPWVVCMPLTALEALVDRIEYAEERIVSLESELAERDEG